MITLEMLELAVGTEYLDCVEFIPLSYDLQDQINSDTMTQPYTNKILSL